MTLKMNCDPQQKLQNPGYAKWLILIFVSILTLFFAAMLWRLRGGVQIQAGQSEMLPASQPVFYSQTDPDWASDNLGDSSCTMASSGCLTTCAASVLAMENLTAANPGYLNQIFSANQIYDSQGNMQWDQLEQVLGLHIERKDGGQVSAQWLEQCISAGIYPIVRVRVKGIGNFHYVVLARIEGGDFQCIDPLRTEDGLVSLKDYGRRVYAARCIIPRR